MTKILPVTLAGIALILLLTIPRTIEINVGEDAPAVSRVDLVRSFLQDKNSPLATEAEFLVMQEHWRLLIAISAIESQYCNRQLYFNCWGVGGDSAYRKYSSFRASIQDANDLITYWQTQGRWKTTLDMNCHYVVPCNDNWVRVVDSVLLELSETIPSP